jgi:CBS-domain-containing membrane protein
VQTNKKIQDIMVGIFDYPHIPYWFSISQTIKIVRVLLTGPKKSPDPMAVLVFDEKYNLMGTLTIRELLKGLEPRFLKASAHAPLAGEAELSLIWDTLFSGQSKELAGKQVSDIMTPAKMFVEPGDPVTKAAYLMLHHDQILLPVLEDGRKLMGLVRFLEVFETISNQIITE